VSGHGFLGLEIGVKDLAYQVGKGQLRVDRAVFVQVLTLRNLVI
jgi:hypothetical protein